MGKFLYKDKVDTGKKGEPDILIVGKCPHQKLQIVRLGILLFKYRARIDKILNDFDLGLLLMKVKGIKRGKNIELLEEIDLPDEQEIILEIQENTINKPEKKSEDKSFYAELSFGEFIQQFRQDQNWEEEGIDSDEFLQGVREQEPGNDEVIW